MADLTPLQTLQRIIARELPTARAKLDSPHTDTGSWFLDVEWHGAIAIIEWRPSQGFGVADEHATFGEGPEYVTSDATAAAFAAIAKLRDMQGTRDTLIISQEGDFRDQLREVLLDIDVFSDAVADWEEALTQLQQHVYRSVVVQLLPDWPDIHGETLRTILVDSNLLTIAVTSNVEHWPPRETPSWAEIFVQRAAPPRELAFLIRGLLQYRDAARKWPRVSDRDGDASN
jgi:hypothetical protein